MCAYESQGGDDGHADVNLPFAIVGHHSTFINLNRESIWHRNPKCPQLSRVALWEERRCH